MHESGEMYLETILVLSKKLDYVRSVDVCDYMGYSKPSVSRAVALLKKGNYIDVDENGHLTLTESGKTIAEKIFERHNVLSNILMQLGVSEKTAISDACKSEHNITDETFEAIKKYFVG